MKNYETVFILNPALSEEQVQKAVDKYEKYLKSNGSKIIAKDLIKEDIYFAGIDFIDEKLNGDINVTSPTGLKTFFDLSNINLADYFWKGLRA